MKPLSLMCRKDQPGARSSLVAYACVLRCEQASMAGTGSTPATVRVVPGVEPLRR